MARFRGRKRPGPSQAEAQRRSVWRSLRRERLERRRQWNRQQAAQWALLRSLCPTKASRTRLLSLVGRMTGPDRGARESALAELELATLLIRAGFQVEILGESHAKSADLACRLGAACMYVEVTALVGSFRRPPPSFHARQRRREAEESVAEHEILLSRLSARISQKAGQLAQYAAPVVLAAAVPHPDPGERGFRRGQGWSMDLKQAAAGLTLLLARLPGLSAVLVTLWDIEPLPARSTLRLANVHIVERSRQQAAYPRVRMLILNPAARHPLADVETAGLRRLL